VAIRAALSTAAPGGGGVAVWATETANATTSAVAVEMSRIRDVMLMCCKPFDKGAATLE